MCARSWRKSAPPTFHVRILLDVSPCPWIADDSKSGTDVNSSNSSSSNLWQLTEEDLSNDGYGGNTSSSLLKGSLHSASYSSSFPLLSLPSSPLSFHTSSCPSYFLCPPVLPLVPSFVRLSLRSSVHRFLLPFVLSYFPLSVRFFRPSDCPTVSPSLPRTLDDWPFFIKLMLGRTI